MASSSTPYLGFGLGLRPKHYPDILAGDPAVDFFEIISENFMIPGGKPWYFLEQVAERYPIVMHGVALSIASTDPLNFDYLQQLKNLSTSIKAKWISDHLCLSNSAHHYSHDLLPIAFTKKELSRISKRILQVQDFLQQQLVLENISTYAEFSNNEMSEAEFIAELLTLSDCGLLLDVNNVFVNSFNHNSDSITFINTIPKDKVVAIHLAGHSDFENYKIDTHDQKIIQAVWDLYQLSIERFGATNTIIERDDNIPPLAELLTELDQARAIASQTIETPAWA